MHGVTRRKILTAALGAGVGMAGAWRASAHRSRTRAAGAPPADASWPSRIRTGRAFGTTVSITSFDADDAMSARAVNAAFDELRRIEDVFSLYEPESQLSRLNRQGFLADPHPWLLEVLEASLALSRETGGAFDVSVQPLWAVYCRSAARGVLPPSSEIEAARQHVDWRRVRIQGRGVGLSPGMALTFNGVAQGFATDGARSVLSAHGLRHALVDFGELGTTGDKPGGSPWKVGIQHPRAVDAYVCVAALSGRCLATSGDYEASFSEDRRDHHIFDPQTGRSPTELASVSVAATTCLQADALSTAVFVMGARRGLALIDRTPGADALFVLKDGSTVKTPGFPEALGNASEHLFHSRRPWPVHPDRNERPVAHRVDPGPHPGRHHRVGLGHGD